MAGGYPCKEMFYDSILSNAMMFDQFSRNAGFRMMSPPRLSFLFDSLWKELTNAMDEYKRVCQEWHPEVNARNLHPFVDRQCPNVLFVIHIVAQSLVAEHV
jgi:hypothetical protein